MKKLYITLLSLLLVACNSNNVSVPQLKFDGLKGNIASIKDSHFDAEMKFGDINPGDLYKVEKQEYDSDGNLTFIGRYDDDGDMEYETRSSFEKGQWVSSVIKNRLVLNQRAFWEKKKNRALERKKNYLKYEEKVGEKVSVYETKYDGLQAKSYSEKGTLVAELTFNKNGQILELKSYADDGKMVYRVVQEFDDKGFLVKSTSYGESCEDSNTFSYKDFDKKGNWLTQIIYDEDGEPEYIVKREISYR